MNEDKNITYDLKLVLHRLDLINLHPGEIMEHIVREQLAAIYSDPYWYEKRNGDD